MLSVHDNLRPIMRSAATGLRSLIAIHSAMKPSMRAELIWAVP